MRKLKIGFIGNFRVCKVPDCGGKHHAKGYCSAHASKMRRWGQLTCPNDRRGKSENSKKNLTYSIPKGSKPWNKGVHYLNIAGENHYNWKGGITSVKRSIRASLEYKLWRKAVLQRDNFTCNECTHRGGDLEVDHIIPFHVLIKSNERKMLFDTNNGRTLCVPCHMKTNTWGKGALNYATA